MPADSKGTVLAMDASLSAAAVMVAPVIGASLYELVGFPSVGIAGGSTVLVTLCLVHLGILEC